MWTTDAQLWLCKFDARLQHAMLRMNHHVHPLDPVSGERKVLNSCRPKDKRNVCKADFPLETYLTDKPLLVCKCIAEARCLVQRGPRSMLGTVLPRRNNAWLNAGPRLWLAFSADNGDIKFPHRLPIIAETHETLTISDQQQGLCCSEADLASMLYDFQAGVSMAAGYFLV